MPNLDDVESDDIGGYRVRTKLDHLGPIVWTQASQDEQGVRRTEFSGAEASALPPELSQREENLLAKIVPSVLHDYIAPELSRRFKVQVSEHDLLSSLDWEAHLREALVLLQPDGQSIVHLNEEIQGISIPDDCGSIRLSREGWQWTIKADWTPILPEEVQRDVQDAVMDLATAILQGDEHRASDLVQLWFPARWEENPASLHQEMAKEVYVLLFHIWEHKDPGSLPEPDLGTQLSSSLPAAIDELRHDYTLESIKEEAGALEFHPRVNREEFLNDVERLFARASLSKQELRVLRLEAALGVRNVQWPLEDKEKFLGMRHGTYSAAAYRARTKVSQAKSHDPHRDLLKAIFGDPRSPSPGEEQQKDR